MVVVVPLARTNDGVDGEAIVLGSDQAAWTSALYVLRLTCTQCVDEEAISLSPLKLGCSVPGSSPQMRLAYSHCVVMLPFPLLDDLNVAAARSTHFLSSLAMTVLVPELALRNTTWSLPEIVTCGVCSSHSCSHSSF